jgi:hypothetical protein
VTLTVDDLERPADDAREWAALDENLSLIHEREAAWRARALAAETELAAIADTRSLAAGASARRRRSSVRALARATRRQRGR